MKSQKNRNKPIVNKILPIPCKTTADFFHKWIEFLEPIHHLTGREQDVLAAILFNMHNIHKSELDMDSVESLVMDREGRIKLREQLNMSQVQLSGILTKLCKMKILKVCYSKSGHISSYKISPSFIPNFDEKESFKLMLVFQNA